MNKGEAWGKLQRLLVKQSPCAVCQRIQRCDDEWEIQMAQDYCVDCHAMVCTGHLDHDQVCIDQHTGPAACFYCGSCKGIQILVVNPLRDRLEMAHPTCVPKKQRRTIVKVME